MFDYLNYKNRIPLHKCVVEIPRINPMSMQYEKFWVQVIKRKQFEGHWVEHNNEHKWLPGPMFQYTSLWHIEMKKKNGASKGKVIGKPRLRDVEWIKGYVHAVARGFSGFAQDERYTCHRILLDEEFEELKDFLEPHVRKGIYNSKGQLKEYKDALEYLYEYQERAMGKPLYHNSALNVVDIECRNIGKTVSSGNFCAHNFLTDGLMDFDVWFANKQLNDLDPEKETFTTQTLVGASDSKYSSNVCKHTRTGLDHLPGKQEIGDELFPSPVAKIYSGSWTAGKDIIARYDEQIGNKWVTKGSGSGFLHRTFKDNEFAANGTRYGFGLIDEVGFMGNLLETLGQLHECLTVDGEKYGTLWMTGTGGDMEGGATEAVKEVFYSPASYDCMTFDDIFEGSTKKIGFFMPAWMALDEFRDELGNVNKELAMRKLLKEREKAKAAKSKKPLNDLMQMKPLVPSEAFLVSAGNVFPVADLTDHLNWLRAQPSASVKGDIGSFRATQNGTVEWVPDLSNDLKPCIYPVKEKDDTTGAVVIWEHPDPSSDYGWYVAGCDPYDLDSAPNSVSLGSIILMKRSTLGNNHDTIVAEYTARPEKAKDFYETARRLLLYYGAICLYENEKNQIKTYFEQQQSLSLLAYTPTVLKSNQNTKVSRIYGQNMSKTQKDELEIYTRDWLSESAGDGRLNLHHIYSEPLLEELIAYNEDGNFDRVIALMLAVCQKHQMHQLVVEKKEEIKKDPFFERRLFTNRRN